MNKIKEFIKRQRRQAHKKIRSAQMFQDKNPIAHFMEQEAQSVLNIIDELPILIEALEFIPPCYHNPDYPAATVDKTAFKALYELDCILQRRTNSYTTEFDDGDCYIYGHHMGIKMSNRPGDYISLSTIIPIEVFYNKWN